MNIILWRTVSVWNMMIKDYGARNRRADSFVYFVLIFMLASAIKLHFTISSHLRPTKSTHVIFIETIPKRGGTTIHKNHSYAKRMINSNISVHSWLLIFIRTWSSYWKVGDFEEIWSASRFLTEMQRKECNLFWSMVGKRRGFRKRR